MGIFDSIFGKKKKVSTTPAVKVEREIYDQKPVVSADKREILLKYADTGRPVVVVGGDFNGKTIVVVGKPSKSPDYTCDGKSYPVVTVDRLTIGTYEQVSFRSDIPQEEIDRLLEIDKQRCEAAEKEKEEFEANKYKSGYEVHRYMRPVAQPTKRKPVTPAKPKPDSTKEEEEEEFQIYTLDADGNEIPIEKPKPKPEPTLESAWMTDEEFEQSRKNQIKEAHFDLVLPEEDHYIYKLNQLIATLPEFDFYNGDNDEEVSEDHPSVVAIRALQKQADEFMAQGEIFEKEEEWSTAAECYEYLVIRR